MVVVDKVRFLAAFAAGLIIPVYVTAEVSPLNVITDGRTKATASSLTEAGLRKLAEQSGDIALYFAGLLGLILGASGVLMLHRAQSEGDGRMTSRGWIMLFTGGLITIPAFLAALVPKIMISGL